MKRQLILCIALVALLASCVKEPIIYRLLLDEEAAAIPYQLHDTVRMLDQDGDTAILVVTYDTMVLYSDYDYWRFFDDSKMGIEPGPYCYARMVQLRNYGDSTHMRFAVLPEKEFVFRWERLLDISLQLTGETENITINGVAYENVYCQQAFDSETEELVHQWFYSEEVGLIAVKNKDRSLVLLP